MWLKNCGAGNIIFFYCWEQNIFRIMKGRRSENVKRDSLWLFCGDNLEQLNMRWETSQITVLLLSGQGSHSLRVYRNESEVRCQE